MEIETLKQQLISLNIDITQWSHDRGTKTIEDLYHEIIIGETTLEIIDLKLVRVVKLVSIEIQVKLGDKSFILVEDKQIFFTGAVRERGLKNLAEKIREGENPDQTVIRALQEEVSLVIDKKPNFVDKTEEIKTSPSYPQLDSVYQVWNYKLNLDQDDLELIKFSEYQKKKGKITLFSLEEID